jgi:hypothetical protein
LVCSICSDVPEDLDLSVRERISCVQFWDVREREKEEREREAGGGGGGEGSRYTKTQGEIESAGDRERERERGRAHFMCSIHVRIFEFVQYSCILNLFHTHVRMSVYVCFFLIFVVFRNCW